MPDLSEQEKSKLYRPKLNILLSKVCPRYDPNEALCQHCEQTVLQFIKTQRPKRFVIQFHPEYGIVIQDEETFSLLVKSGRMHIVQCNPLCG